MRKSLSEVWTRLMSDLARTRFPSEAGELLGEILTPHEKEQIAGRAAAAELLTRGKSYREIGDELWLSSSTISAIRKSMIVKTGYTSRRARWKTEGRKRKHFSAFPKRVSTDIIMPHGKLAFPRKRKK